MESLLKNLKQRLTCSICLDIYNEPKTISCLHTFCCECLSNHARASHRQGKFRCPECQAQIDLSEGNRFKSLPSSFFHNSLLSLLAIRRSGDGSNISCSQCRKNNSRMYYCFDCGKFMCPDCYNSHEMLKASFEGHKVTPVKEFKAEDYEALMKRQPFCSQQFHEKEITRFFCFSCQECVCQICIVTEPHRNHEVVLLDRAAHDEKPNIMSGAEMIKEKISELDEVIRKFEETISELDKNVATAKRGVSQAAEEMIAKIREREQEAIVLLETTRVTRLEGINSAMQEAQSLVRQMKQAVEFAYNLVQRSSSSDIMQNKDTLKQRFEVLRAVEVPKHNDTSFIEFWAATAENLKLGFIMVSEEEHGGYGGGGYGGGGYRQQQSSYRQYQQSNQQQRPRYQQNYNQQQQQSTAQTSYSPQQQYGTGAAYNQYYSYNQGYQATGYQQTGYAQQPQTYDQTAQQQGYMDYQNYHAGYRGGYI